MKNKIIVIDDFFPDKYFKEISCFFKNLKWNYYIDCSFIDEVEKKINFNYFDDNLNSCFTSYLIDESLEKYKKFLKETALKHNIYIDDINRGFLNVFFTRKELRITSPHINLGDNHIVSLLYMNDTDGETIFFDQTKNEIPFKEQEKYREKLSEKYQFTIRKKIKPQKNRMVFFCGSIYHAPEIPTQNTRFTVTTEYKNNFWNMKYE